MRNFTQKLFSSFSFILIFAANLVSQDASLPFPQVAFGSPVIKNSGLNNEVMFKHSGCVFSTSEYTDCYTYTYGNTIRIDNNADYFLIRCPRTTLYRIDITISANNTTPVVAIVGFSEDSITWTNFQELDALAVGSVPSCMLYSLNPPLTAKYFKIMRVGFGGYTPVGPNGITTIRIYSIDVWTNYTYDVELHKSTIQPIIIFPNPTQSEVKISYVVREKSQNKLIISSILGETIAILEDAEKAAGEYQVSYDCSTLPEGVYIVTWINGSACISKKLIKN